MMPSPAADRNVILIGMPGVGKSTSGVLLAKVLSRNFMDTDVYIQARVGRRLQEIIDQDGLEAFCKLEARAICSLKCKGFVIATGGSVIYSDRAMRHLKKNGTVVHLDLPARQLEARIRDMDSRGIVMGPGRTIADLYAERIPLYRRYADITLDCRGLNHEQVGYAVVQALENR
jgi:shikimate kinase